MAVVRGLIQALYFAACGLVCRTCCTATQVVDGYFFGGYVVKKFLTLSLLAVVAFTFAVAPVVRAEEAKKEEKKAEKADKKADKKAEKKEEKK